jgi:hypothetical protein
MRSLCLALALAFIPTGVVHARREATFAYPYARVWNAAVRMVRVDLEAAIPEKDRDDGYFLFEFPHDGKTYPGSIQLIRGKARGVEQVQVVIQLPSMPSYVELMLLDKLQRKLSVEFGSPLEPKAEPEPAPKPAAPSDGDSAPAPEKGAKKGPAPSAEK